MSVDEVSVGDPGRVRQILRNLLTNAKRHGGDEITVELTSSGPDARVLVCDNGQGVPEEDHDQIFDPYHHGVTGSQSQPFSMGLGLTVARRLARLMGGDLTYRFEERTIFDLTPTADPSDDAQTVQYPAPLPIPINVT